MFLPKVRFGVHKGHAVTLVVFTRQHVDTEILARGSHTSVGVLCEELGESWFWKLPIKSGLGLKAVVFLCYSCIAGAGIGPVPSG